MIQKQQLLKKKKNTCFSYCEASALQPTSFKFKKKIQYL
jgi:hypothetical protein